jgi:hypothetical protein
MRTRRQLTEEMIVEAERLPKIFGDLTRGTSETGPSFRLAFTFFLGVLGIIDAELRLVLLRYLTARALCQFGEDSRQLTRLIFEYVLCVLLLAVVAVIYLLTLVIVRPLEVLLEQLKK